MSRRITGLFSGLALSLLAACTHEAKPIQPANNTEERESVSVGEGIEWDTGRVVPFHSLAEVSLTDTDILFIGYIHGQLPIHNTMFSQEAVATYARAGVTQFMMEETTETDQATLDAYLAQIEARIAAGKPIDMAAASMFLMRDASIALVPVDPRTSAEKQLMYTAKTDEERARALYKCFQKDPYLAENIMLSFDQSGKAIVSFGADHGASPRDGLPELIEQAGLTMLRIDVYSDMEMFRNNEGMRAMQNRVVDEYFPNNNLTIGAELPHLVYFASEGKAFCTKNTPGFLRSAVPAIATDNAPEPK